MQTCASATRRVHASFTLQPTIILDFCVHVKKNMCLSLFSLDRASLLTLANTCPM